MNVKPGPATSVPQLYSTFRNNIGTIQHTYVRQAIRQAVQEVQR